ncbi:hypothetical protein [Flagellimonas sp.]|uniref:hypothetical protein n=1 Tax=Flagellimonas sp. TaxID=2058762 RepID=UPI003BADB913
MIYFQTLDGFQYDLTEYGLTFNEESPWFSNESKSNYVLPFNAPLDSDLAVKLDLVTEPNVSDYKSRLDGYLVVDNEMYDAYLGVYDVLEKKMELRLFYGKEVLQVFKMRLSELPFPIVDTEGDLDNFSQQALSRTWPEVTHNFPMAYRPKISELSDYGDFNGYVNLRSSSLGGFRTNSTLTVDGETRPYNYNVVAPMPYLLEVLKVGFGTEGLEIRGEFVEHPLIRKLLMVPSKYFEYYSDPNIREVYSFENSSNINDGLQTFTKSHNTSKNGTYSIHARLNFPKGVTKNFSFTVSYNGKTYFKAVAKSEGVTIDEKIDINVSNGVFTPITVALEIDKQQRDIDKYNNLVFDFKDGRINRFPDTYSLKEIMPNTEFRTFFDAIVEWANLDVTYYENSVYLDFLDNSILNRVFNDQSGFEDPEHRRDTMKNNLFKLKYMDGKQVWVSKDGQVYDDGDYTTSEINSIDFKVLPLIMERLNDVFTGTWPEEEAPIVIGIYNGIVDSLPTMIESINDISLSLNDVFENFHRNWLSFRANAEVYNDKFEMLATDTIDLKNGIFKYNKKFLVSKIKKRRINEHWWQVHMESESF